MKILKCFWFFVFKILFVLKVKLFTFNSERKSPRTMSAVQPHHNLKIHRKGLISNFDWSLDFVSLVSCLHGTWKPNKKTQTKHTHTHMHARVCMHTNTPHMQALSRSLTQQQQQPPKHCNTDSACSFARSNEKKLNRHICTGHNLCRWLDTWIPPFSGKLLHKQDQSKEVTSGLSAVSLGTPENSAIQKLSIIIIHCLYCDL